mmetsp:Transcript_533/g.680  ORF Transcript_533/g.680 Transcript_533/m.680 type:complete len:99 (+) Transcript_533:17-313(+)
MFPDYISGLILLEGGFELAEFVLESGDGVCKGAYGGLGNREVVLEGMFLSEEPFYVVVGHIGLSRDVGIERARVTVIRCNGGGVNITVLAFEGHTASG